MGRRSKRNSAGGGEDIGAVVAADGGPAIRAELCEPLLPPPSSSSSSLSLSSSPSPPAPLLEDGNENEREEGRGPLASTKEATRTRTTTTATIPSAPAAEQGGRESASREIPGPGGTRVGVGVGIENSHGHYHPPPRRRRRGRDRDRDRDRDLDLGLGRDCDYSSSSSRGSSHDRYYDGTFVPPPPMVPVAERVPSDPGTVRIVAPAAFAAGYEFVATLEDGRAFAVTVDDGIMRRADGNQDDDNVDSGVGRERYIEEGEEILVPYPREFLATTVVPPAGHWKDGLCACCRFGCCHAMVCLPLLCPLVALGQIMTRMRLTALANPGPTWRTKQTFRILVLLAVLRFALAIALGSVPDWYMNPTLDRILGGFGLLLITVQIVLTALTRRRVRIKYGIPPVGACCGFCGCCRGCCGCGDDSDDGGGGGVGGCLEDLCRATLCGCCTIAQMGRHTADYETYRGVCCSSTGLPRNAPAV